MKYNFRRKKNSSNTRLLSSYGAKCLHLGRGKMSADGLVKLADGLFFGDESASSDLDFVVANKVGRIVNCCGRQIVNHFESMGVEYLTYNWVDNDSQIILDIRGVVINEVCEFINAGIDKGESVLVHSFRGQSRCICIMTAYLIKEYSWTLNKALQYIQSRRTEIALKPAFHRQLVSYERRRGMEVTLTSSWDTTMCTRNNGEEIVLMN